MGPDNGAALCRRVCPFNVGWIEEPLHPDDIVGHAALCAKSSVPIALGENVYSAEASPTSSPCRRLTSCRSTSRESQASASGSGWPTRHKPRARAVIPHAGDMMQVHQHLVGATSPARAPMIESPIGPRSIPESRSSPRGTITLPSKPGASSSIAKEARRRWQE